MNILLCSVPYRPSIGGIETVSALLAERFERLGHRVVVVTRTPGDAEPGVVRRPSPLALLGLVRWADVVFHNNISLRFAWPLLLLARPWVVAHHTWIPVVGIAARLKRRILPCARNVAVSRALADSLPVPCSVLPNPYDDGLFAWLPGVPRERELVFVGRLVSDKGVDRLLDALALLAERGLRPRLSLIGDGPEAAALRRQAAELGLDGQVEFRGRVVGRELVAALHAHQVLVVPSVWEEPFGLVALEALACGCVPLVTRSGGLPEAVGACGLVVGRDDPAALAHGIATLLEDPSAAAALRAGARDHLARHARDRIARDYLRILAAVRPVRAAQDDAHAG
ncbi:MAG TPA: glycosyltransferase family 4 protein [Methylibium sp.]|nr:glycosyltransferase family 4 protein [Methylibium sp.]